MKFLLSFLIVVSTFASSFAHAQMNRVSLLNSAAAAGPATRGGFFSDACRCNDRDPFDYGPVMPFGKYEGQCQNTCESRSIILINSPWNRDDDTTPTFRAPPQSVWVTNIKHGKYFYKANVPLVGVKDVILQLVYSHGIALAAHTQSRIRFDRDIELIPQIVGATPSVFVRDLILSYESNAPKDVPFNIVTEGMARDYTIAYRLRTVEDFMTPDLAAQQDGVPAVRMAPRRASTSFFTSGDKGVVGRVEQTRIELDSLQRNAFWARGLAHADASGSFQPYHTLEKNCATEMLNGVLDATLGLEMNQFNQWLVIYPVWNPGALEQRHVKGARLADLSVEWACRKAGGTEDSCFTAQR